MENNRIRFSTGRETGLTFLNLISLFVSIHICFDDVKVMQR